MFEEIKKLKSLKLKPSQVAKKLNIDTRTVKKYWDMSEADFLNLLSTFSKNKSASKLDFFKSDILEYLNTFQDFTAAQIFDRLKEENSNFSLSESSVRKYVAKLKKQLGISNKNRIREYIAVPELPMGKQAQVDFGEITLLNENKENIKLYVFLMVLSHSRYKFGIWQDKPFNSKDFVEAHKKAFEYFGGVPEEIVYDRTKVALISENNDGTFKLSKDFEKYVSEVEFNPIFCKPYDPESKGKIEAVVKFVKDNFAKHRIFKDIESFNTSFFKWLDRTGNRKIHETTKKVPAEVFTVEKQYLSSKHINKPASSITHKVKKDNTISFQGNKYSLPKGTFTAIKEVGIDVINNFINIRTLEGNLIISYSIPSTKGNLVQKDIYHKDLSKSILELKEEVFLLFNKEPRVVEYIEKLCTIDSKNIRRNLEKFKELKNGYSLEILLQAIEYSFSKNIFSISNLTTKAQKYSSSKENKFFEKKAIINTICDVKTRNISEYQKLQEE